MSSNKAVYETPRTVRTVALASSNVVEMTGGQNYSVGCAKRVPSAPSIGTLMEMLSMQQSTLASQHGGANSTFSEEDLMPAGGGSPTLLSSTASQTNGNPLGQRRPSDRSAVSAGRALLAPNKPPAAKATNDGALYYEVKTSSAGEGEGNMERRVPRRRRRRTGAVHDASSEHQSEPSTRPPRKNGSFLGRSRDSFLLRLLARESTEC